MISDYSFHIDGDRCQDPPNDFIYMIDANMFYDLVRQDRKYLKVYYPNLTEQYQDMIQLKTRVDERPEFVEEIKREQRLETTIKTEFRADAINTCYLLHMIVHVNYQEDSNDFIDLIRVFDRFKLDMTVPFIKYRGENPKTPMYKIFRGIKDTVRLDQIQNWISPPRKQDSSFSTKTVYPLSFRLQIAEQTYATVDLYKDGRIEFKCAWDENKPTSTDAIELTIGTLNRLIDKINQISYHLPDIDHNKKITLANPKFLENQSNQTRFTMINVIVPYTDIKSDLSVLSNYLGKFPKFVKLEPVDSTEQVVTLQMRYIRLLEYSIH